MGSGGGGAVDRRSGSSGSMVFLELEWDILELLLCLSGFSEK